MTRAASFAFALALLGCAEEPPPPPCDLCAPPSAALSGAAGAWLVSRVELRVTEGVVADGVDVDGQETDSRAMRATDCRDQTTDRVAAWDPRVRGVDSAGQELVEYGEQALGDGSTFEAAFDEAVADGRIRWAIEVGAAVALDEERWELPIAFHRIAPDETIATEDATPAAGQTLRSVPLGTVRATVLGDAATGLFVGGVTDLGVVDDDVLLLPFDAFGLQGLALDARDPVPVLHLGGSVTVDALTERFAEIFMSSPRDAELARTIFAAVADLDPDPADPFECRRVSIGLRASLVPVTLTPE